MSDKTGIEWTDATWNPITGCTLVSDGCKNCYAAQLAATRLKNHPSRKGLARVNAHGTAKFTGEVRFNEQWLLQPLHWKKPRMIFVCAHGDLFHEDVPDEWIDKVFAVAAMCPQHTLQVLTKRPERARDYLSTLGATQHDRIVRTAKAAAQITGTPIAPNSIYTDVFEALLTPLPNVWLGTSVENQATANERIPALLDTPAALRWISAEPLLGPVDLARWLNIAWVCSYCRGYFNGAHQKVCPDCGETGGWCGSHKFNGRKKPLGPISSRQIGQGLDWVVAGGESGAKARPMHPAWVRQIRDQCEAAQVPFLFKQWGQWAPLENDADWEKHGKDKASHSTRLDHNFAAVGKKQSGRELDGKLYDDFPQIGGA